MGLSDTVTGDFHRSPQEIETVRDFHREGGFKQETERCENPKSCQKKLDINVMALHPINMLMLSSGTTFICVYSQ